MTKKRMAVSDHERKRKRKIKIKSKSESNGEEGRSNRKAKSVKHKRLKRKINMEEGCSEKDREKRGRKVPRKKRINHSECPIAKRKPNPAFSEPPSLASNPRTLKWAELALAHYEKKQGAQFKTLHVVAECSRFLACCINVPMGWYCHLFFKAMPRNVNCADLSPKTFFAELNICGEKVDVITCCIMEPDDPGKKLGCGICPVLETLPHPNTGFIAGRFPYELPCIEDYP